MDLGLTGKTALVTGAHRGTGLVIARALASEGAKVILQGPDEDKVADAVAECTGRGLSVDGLCGDLLSDEGAAELIGTLTGKGAGIDILVNNFGRADPAKWSDAGTEDWILAANVNLLSAIRLAKLCVPAMKERHWGRILNLGTIGSTRPNAAMPGYYAAKAAFAATTVSLAKELKGSGITVNHVSPGLIRTPEVEENFLAYAKRKGWGEVWEDVEARITEKFMPNPTGRLSTREDIADLVCFLASPRAGHINGQNIRIDGGAVDHVT